MRFSLKSLLLIPVLLLALWALGSFVVPLTLPFLFGTGLALASEPLVRFLCTSCRLPRGAATGMGVTAVFLLLTSLALSLAALLLQQLKAAAGILPDLEQTFLTGISLMEQQLLSLSDLAPQGIRPLLKKNILGFFSDGTAFLSKAGTYLLGLAGGLLTHIPDGALSLGTTVLSGFMISAKLPGIRSWLRRQMDRDSWQPVLTLLRRIRRSLGRWILAELKLMGVTWLILVAGLILLAVPSAPLWALGIAALDALPILGTGTVLIPWSLICFLSGSRVRALGLLGTYLTACLTRTVLEPRLVGKHLGLDPLAALAALYMGFKIWGFGGMLIAPMLAVTALQVFPGENPGFQP